MGNTVLRPDAQQVDGSPAIAAPPSGRDTAGLGVEVWWRLIETFNPTKHQGTYLFADEHNVIMGHWYADEPEPRMSYCGQGGHGDFPIWPLYWMPVPLSPSDTRDAAKTAESRLAKLATDRMIRTQEYERRQATRDGEAAKREPSSTANTDETSDIHTK